MARGFQHQDFEGFDLQEQADLMAEAVGIYDRVVNAEDPVEAEAALAPIVADDILEFEQLDDDDDD